MKGITRDIAYALRSISRTPLTAMTIVATISVGLGVVAVLFTFLNSFVFRADRVPDVNAIYAIELPEIGDGVHERLTRLQFEALRSETRVFTDAYATVPDVDLRVHGRTMSVTLVSGNFFSVVRVQPAIGRAFSASEDGPSGGAAVIVLSDRGWDRRFNRDPNVLGTTVLVSGVPFEIIGVMPAGFRGLSVGAPDFWAPLSTVAEFMPSRRGNEDAVGVDVVGRLRADVSRENGRAQIAAWISNQRAAADRRDMTIDLVPHRGTVPQPMQAIAIFTPLFIAFGLILLIGCANVANLLLARGVARQREIGIRLSIGASRGRILRQLMTESLLLALVSAAGGYLVSRMALQSAIAAMLSAAPVDIGDVNLTVPAADWRVAVFLVIAAIVSTAVFALMPALQATRIDPVRTLRGELVKEARPGRARNWLIGVQVFASALLLICASIFLRSGIASTAYDPGFRSADTVMIDLNNESTRAAIIQAIAAEPEITASAAVRPSMLDTRAGLATIGASKTAVNYKFVSGGYFDVMGVPIVRGRTFTAAERERQPVAIVSESMARMLWPNGEAIGQAFRLDPDTTSANRSREPELPSQTVTVVGVSRDIKGFRFGEVKAAVIFLPTSLDAPGTTAMARVAGDPDLARQTLIDHLTQADPNLGMIVTMRTIAGLEKFLLNVAFWIAFVLGAVALLLTVSGLFSVLSYLVAQRSKEIGVRMALGASSRQVMRLMLSQTARPVAVGLLAGVGVAAALAAVLLSTPFGAVIAQIVHVADPVAYAGSLVVIVAACLLAAAVPARRAARVDPMQTLRAE